tara:strand:+ start:1004 stop:1912 length:909 start_codon:yes stop_codon:yes gene_type:complete
MSLNKNLNIKVVEDYALKTKLGRLLFNPVKYITGIFSKLIYFKLTKKGFLVNTDTFWNKNISLELPACLDIYLSGGKTHESEIRFAKYLINSVSKGDQFLDIGAHIGYFSLLFSELNGKGKILSFEASPKNFDLLEKNVKNSKIEAFNIAVSDKNGILKFMEFPILFSEYNTSNLSIYKNENWFKSLLVKEIDIPSIKGDNLVQEYEIDPTYIKIDVEGAEKQVLLGFEKYLSKNNPKIIMEFAKSKDTNSNHKEAETILIKNNFHPHIIKNDGSLEKLIIESQDYVNELEIESDNIVYLKE